MLFMFFHTPWIYKYVINENHDKLVQLWHEYGVHDVHEMCRCIHQSKRHDKILIKLVSHRESRLGDIFITDFNLMIARPEINLGKYLGSHQLIKQDVDVWERILVLDSDYI
jgi:Zn ribbon nucleic-acid-binding protein